MLEKELEFAKSVANEAGKIMLKYFGNAERSYKFEGKEIVTVADTEINNYLIEQVKKYFPNHAVSGEEESFGESNIKWVCDPIDGTEMYACNIPTASFSLALVVDGVSELGVIFDPFLNRLYYATRGGGAYLNGEKIFVNNSKVFDRHKSVMSFCCWEGCGVDIYGMLSKTKWYSVALGSAVRNGIHVATGDFICSVHPGNRNYDIAALKVIVEEAGGRVTNIYGREQHYDGDIKGAIISNGKIHDEVVKNLSEFINSTVL